jgi:hypothetical protein
MICLAPPSCRRANPRMDILTYIKHNVTMPLGDHSGHYTHHLVGRLVVALYQFLHHKYIYIYIWGRPQILTYSLHGAESFMRS